MGIRDLAPGAPSARVPRSALELDFRYRAPVPLRLSRGHEARAASNYRAARRIRAPARAIALAHACSGARQRGALTVKSWRVENRITMRGFMMRIVVRTILSAGASIDTLGGA